MVAEVPEFVKPCLYCVDSREGKRIPWRFDTTAHGTSPKDVVHFEFLYVGDCGPLG